MLCISSSMNAFTIEGVNSSLQHYPKLTQSLQHGWMQWSQQYTRIVI